VIRAILLCGGTGSRFGGGKLLARVDGEAIGVLAAKSLLEGAGNALAVVRPGDPVLRNLLAVTGCEILETPHAERGMGASLAAAVLASPDAEGWVVALGDMPHIRAATHRAVMESIRKGALLAAAVSAGTKERGHPVAFSRPLFAELASLDGDEGARSVVARHRDKLVAVPVDDPGIFHDIDMPEDIARPDPAEAKSPRGDGP
jgi:molybdenum cofactor cytidylyltransferase